MTSTTFNIFLNVISALMVRDLKMRSGKFFLGLAFLIFVPFLHVLIISFIFSISGRVASVEGDLTTFFGISILPFVVWLYPARNILHSISLNKPLLYFPRVRLIDLVISRGLVEILAGVISCSVIFILILVVSGSFSPSNPLYFALSVFCSLLLGFAFGYMNAIISSVSNFWPHVFGLSAPIFWMASGVIYNPSAIPEPYISMLSVNPLLHCVEAIRHSYYLKYDTSMGSLSYPFLFAISLIALSLLAERLGRKTLLAA